MKVIRIDASNAIVGCDNGTTKTYPLSAFNYTPMVGDEVQVYGDGGKCNHRKSESKQSAGQQRNWFSECVCECKSICSRRSSGEQGSLLYYCTFGWWLWNSLFLCEPHWTGRVYASVLLDRNSCYYCFGSTYQSFMHTSRRKRNDLRLIL